MVDYMNLTEGEAQVRRDAERDSQAAHHNRMREADEDREEFEEQLAAARTALAEKDAETKERLDKSVELLDKQATFMTEQHEEIVALRTERDKLRGKLNALLVGSKKLIVWLDSREMLQDARANIKTHVSAELVMRNLFAKLIDETDAAAKEPKDAK